MRNSGLCKTRGRPRSEKASCHGAILDAVFELLHQRSVRDLTMEEVAKRAQVGKPTLYKWWPTKAQLVLAAFRERVAPQPDATPMGNGQPAVRARVRALIEAFGGLFGKVMADLVAEGQGEPVILAALYDDHIRPLRAAGIAEIVRCKSEGLLGQELNAELVMDGIVGVLYCRLLLRSGPLTKAYGDALVDQLFRVPR